MSALGAEIKATAIAREANIQQNGVLQEELSSETSRLIGDSEIRIKSTCVNAFAAVTSQRNLPSHLRLGFDCHNKRFSVSLAKLLILVKSPIRHRQARTLRLQTKRSWCESESGFIRKSQFIHRQEVPDGLGKRSASSRYLHQRHQKADRLLLAGGRNGTGRALLDARRG